MYKRMLRSVLGTAFAAAALLLVAHGSTPDVGWGNARTSAAVALYQGDVGWGNVQPAAAGGLHQDDVGWGNSVGNRAEL